MKNTFVEGLFYKEPHANAPDFVTCGLSFNKEKFLKWLAEQEAEKGYVNIDILLSKANKHYAKLNTFKPKKNIEDVQKEVTPSDLEF